MHAIWELNWGTTELKVHLLIGLIAWVFFHLRGCAPLKPEEEIVSHKTAFLFFF